MKKVLEQKSQKTLPVPDFLMSQTKYAFFAFLLVGVS
jgi:hypothetical protein